MSDGNEIALERINDCVKSGHFSLDLSYLGLKQIPKEILSLINIEQLNLSNNDIKELPSFLFELKELRILSLQNNCISYIPKEIRFLKKLVRIDLINNEVSRIDDEIGDLENLTTLYLSKNKLTSLPRSLSKLHKLKVLAITENPFKIPSEIVHGSLGGLLNYLQLLNEGDVFSLCEAKLLVVGEGYVGKTELCRAILKKVEKNSPVTTEGITVGRWITKGSKQQYILNIWDFGGQEIYHATHQYFLTEKSVYLFVWNARPDDDLYSFDYWLNVIKLLSKSAPVIVVQNKCDERTKEIDYKGYSEKYNNIVGYYNTSAITNEGVEELKKRIIKEVESLDHFNKIVPIAWIKIREDLESISAPYISHEAYLLMCNKYGIDAEKTKWLSEYFHVLGVFLYFPDNLILSNILFLQPEWATGAAYCLFDDPEVIENNGKFTNKTLKRIWNKYPTSKHAALLELMKKFELCFEIDSSGCFIAPSRLIVAPPKELKLPRSELNYFYEYEFLPAGIIERSIVRLHKLIYEDNYWKNGVLLKKGDTSALLSIDRFKKTISISLNGTAKSDLLAIIRNEIEQIHISLNNPKVKEKMPCFCTECLKSDPYYFDIETVERARNRRINSIECRKSFEAVSISTILGGVNGTIESKENEMLHLLRELVDRYDTKESLSHKLNTTLELKPNFMGIGVNINALIEKVLSK